MKIPIVDENDNLVCSKDREERKSNEITRVTGLWVEDFDGNILLAQRAFSKRNEPGLWGPAVAGTVEEGETYESNIIKEAEEEIGLTEVEFKLGPKFRRSTTHEFFVQFFTVVLSNNYLFRKKDDEINSLKWFSRNELLDTFQKNPGMFVPKIEQYLDYFLSKNETQS